ncbi:MAG: PAS domain S-box protein [Methanomassiliicoccus sp.]|nr:PAS domain S-box protein [Methanomassiliicoccus sp.]
MIRVLYVDDEEALLEIGKAFLEMSGDLSVDTINSAEGAEMMMASTSYDAVISDYQMPVMNGIDFLKLLRRRNNKMPFILFTGKGREQVVIEALNEGADFYLQKGGEPTAQFVELEYKIKEAVRRRRAEESALTSNAKLNAALHSMTDAVLIADPQGGIVEVNEAFVRFHRLKDKKEAFKRLSQCLDRNEVFLPDGTPVVADQRSVPRALRGETATGVEYRLQRKDTGESWWGSYSFGPIRDEVGAIVGAVVAVRDITEKKESVERLKRSEKNLADAQRIAHIGSWEWNFRTGELSWSDEMYRIFGEDRQRFTPTMDAFYRYIHPDDRELVKREIDKIMLGNSPINFDFRIVTTAGSVRVLNVFGEIARFDEEGKPLIVIGSDQDITDRKKAELRLLWSNDLMKNIVEHSRSGIAVLDRDLRYLYASKRFFEEYNVSSEDVIGRHHYEVFPDLPQRFRDVHQRALAGEVLSAEDDPYQRSDGSITWTRWECRPWYDAEDVVGGIILYAEVINAHKKVKESSLLFKHAMDSSLNANFIIDDEAILAYANQTFMDLVKVSSKEELVGHKVRDFLILSDEKRTEAYESIARTGHWYSQAEFARRDGSSIMGEMCLSRVEDDKGRDLGFITGSILNLNERLRLERDLKESDDRYRALFEAIPDPIFQMDAETGGILDVNPAAVRTYGFSHDELVRMQNTDLSAEPEKAPSVVTAAQEVIPVRYHRRRDGTVFPVEITSNAYDQKGRRVLIAIGRDVTERKEAEDRLRESEAKYREVFTNADDGIHIHEANERGEPGRFIDINDSACRMLGYSRDEVLGMGPLDIAASYHDPPLDQILESLRIHGRARFETELRRKDGLMVPVEINAHTLMTGDSVITTSVVRDITDKKRRTNALKLANRKLNLLSSITRHDLNNLLTIINGNLALLEREHPELAGNSRVKNISANAERMGDIIAFTKTYENLGNTDPEWQTIREVVQKAAGGINLGAVRLVNDIPPSEQVLADPLIVKVFYSLLDNAIRHGGEVTEIRLWVERDGTDLKIICQDDGVGIAAEEKERVFQLGYGKNTGLGLFLAREIFGLTGAQIQEVGELGQGARFEIIVPPNVFRE